MKSILILFTILLNFLTINEKKSYDIVVKEVTIAINKKSSKNIDKYLAKDFTFFEQKGEIAKLVLTEYLKQIDDTLKSYNKISEKKSKQTTTVTYQFNYKKKGKQNVTFVFNDKNQIEAMKLSNAEVKVTKSVKTY